MLYWLAHRSLWRHSDAHRLRHIPEKGKQYTKTLMADLMGVSTQNRHKNGRLQETATEPTTALPTPSPLDTLGHFADPHQNHGV